MKLNKFLIGLTFICCLSICGFPQTPSPVGVRPQPPEGKGVVVLKAARLVDGTGSAPITNAVVVVRENMITAAGAASSVTIPAGVLPANFTNDAFVIFAHVTSTTNATTQTTATVGSATYFTIVTTAASAAPVLAIIKSGTNVLLEWPTNAAGYTLEFASNLTSSAWSTNLPVPVVVNTNKVVTNGISGMARFFRLQGS